MSQNTFPKFTNMIVNEEDLQIIVDSLREEDRNRTTRDGIFTPGIVNKKSDYLSAGSLENSIKIKPFVAYTKNGNRIEVETTWDDLYPSGTIINVSTGTSEYIDIPKWERFQRNYTDLVNENSRTAVLKLAKLGKGSVLHGIKLRTNTEFSNSLNPNVYVSIGIENEPEKFLPQTLISQNISATDLSAMNLLYSISDNTDTDILLTFTSDVNLNTLISGTLTINLCIAKLRGFDNEDTTIGGDAMSSTSNNWQANTLYHIVARYVETPISDSERSLNYTDANGNTISTTPEYTRYTSDVKFYALRKSGNNIDYTTSDDVKLGEVTTGPADENGKSSITGIYINGKNAEGDDYTQYLSIPGYRFTENIDASQIADGSVDNTKFQYLNTLTGNVQIQLSSKSGLATDNTFSGINTFENQIIGSIDKVNGFSANATPAPNHLLVLDENGKIPADALSESTVASIGNFYTVSSGITNNGRASFLTSTDNESVTVNASTSNPLVINYPDGTSEKITSNQTLTSITSDGYYYLVKEKGGNFEFLPTTGGTIACVPTIDSSNAFSFLGVTGGSVSKTFGNTTESYLAFDGTLNTGANMGSITYTNYNNIETTTYLPSSINTSLIVSFPVAIVPTAFAACFRMNETDATPKTWELQGTNVELGSATESDWVDIVKSSDSPATAASGSTWNVNEIKTIKNLTSLSNIAYKNFRFTFYVNNSTINNYIVGEQTSDTGTTMPINCYYFQLYTINNDPSIKGNIIEGYVQPTNMSMGSYFLDISKKPYTGYKCTDVNTFTETNFVKLGFIEATELGTTNKKITCYPFCYNTFTISDENTTWIINSGTKTYTNIISKNTPITFDHNLGLVPNIVNIKYQCLEAINGYSAGEYIDDIYALEEIEIDSDETIKEFVNIKDLISATVTSVTLWPGTSTSTLYVRNKSGSLEPTQNSKWAVIIYCSRGW